MNAINAQEIPGNNLGPARLIQNLGVSAHTFSSTL